MPGSEPAESRGLLKFELLQLVLEKLGTFPLFKEGEAGVSHGLPWACGTAAPCIGLRVLQGLREIFGG